MRKSRSKFPILERWACYNNGIQVVGWLPGTSKERITSRVLGKWRGMIVTRNSVYRLGECARGPEYRQEYFESLQPASPAKRDQNKAARALAL